MSSKHTYFADISESQIRKEMPEILDILLLCRTTSTVKNPKNIIWANRNYLSHGETAYSPTAQIKPELITGKMERLIMPRALKTAAIQQERTKSRAEVFTPRHIVKMQNDIVDEQYAKDDLETYINRHWLEITCGEAPYMTSRYEMESGKMIPLNQRVGFIDRKLRRLNREIDDHTQWQMLAKQAYQAGYGFEWNGDSLLLARENLLYTYIDFYVQKWKETPDYQALKEIAEIISYNLFQMDGLKFIIPFSEIPPITTTITDLFGNETILTLQKGSTGKKAKVMNWKTGKMQYFTTGMKK